MAYQQRIAGNTAIYVFPLFVAAALEACRLRLRPILMTSIAFIAGVFPLVISTGAGAEMRQAMGVAVFAGMIGVTFFGLFLIPVFYVVIMTLAARFNRQPAPASLPTSPGPITPAPASARDFTQQFCQCGPRSLGLPRRHQHMGRSPGP